MGKPTKSRYKLICFDLDGTLVDNTDFFWISLYRHIGVPREKSMEYYHKYMRGEITYAEWCETDLKWMKEGDVTIETIKHVVAKMKPMKNAKKMLAELKKRGYKLAVISGSVDTVIELLFPEYPFDYIFINKLEFDSEGRVKSIIPSRFDMEHKAAGLKHIAKLEGITTEQCVFVGDHDNDIHVAEEAGLAIAFNCKSEELASVSDIEIKEKDLWLILEHIATV